MKIGKNLGLLKSFVDRLLTSFAERTGWQIVLLCPLQPKTSAIYVTVQVS